MHGRLEAVAPEGEPGEVVSLSLRCGQEEVEVPWDFSYPEERFTRQVPIDSLKKGLVKRFFCSRPGYRITSAIIAGDVNGNGSSELVFSLWDGQGDREGVELVILSWRDDLPAEVDLGQDQYVVARLSGETYPIGDVLGAADFDGDGKADILTAGYRYHFRPMPTAIDYSPHWYVIWGSEEFPESGEISPGQGALLIETPFVLDDTNFWSYSRSFFVPSVLGGFLPGLCLNWVWGSMGKPWGGSSLLYNGMELKGRDSLLLPDDVLSEELGVVATVNQLFFSQAGDLFNPSGPDLILHFSLFDEGPTEVYAYFQKKSSPAKGRLAGDQEVLGALAGFGKLGAYFACGANRDGVVSPIDLTGDGIGELVLGLNKRGCQGGGSVLLLDGELLPDLISGDSWVVRPERPEEMPVSGWLLINEDGEFSEISSRVRAAGDVDGDGSDELVLQAVCEGGEDKYAVFLVYGDPFLLEDEISPVSTMGEKACRLVASAVYPRLLTGQQGGDANGDGFRDLLLGASAEPDSKEPVPEAYLILGAGAKLWDLVWEESAEGMFLRGDVNADGRRNLADAIALLGSLFGGKGPLQCADAGDANDDGRLNLADAIAILQHLFGGAVSLPEPFASCGKDQTEDQLDCKEFPICQ